MNDTSAIAAQPPRADLETLPVPPLRAAELSRAPALDDALVSLKTHKGLVVIADLILISMPVLAAAASSSVPARVFGTLWLFPVVTMAALALRGMYDTRLRLSALEDAGRVAVSTGLAAIAVLALGTITAVPNGRSLATVTAQVWLAATMLLAIGHYVVARLRRADTASEPGTRILIVGGGDVAARVERRLTDDPQGLRVVAYLDVSSEEPDEDDEDALNAELRRVALQTRADHVIFAFASVRDSVLVPLVRECRTLGLRVSVVPRLFEAMNASVSVEHLGGLPLVRVRHVDPMGWQFAVKHALDRSAAAIVMVLLAPVFVVIAMAVKLSSPGPVLYRQRRVGRDGRSFMMLKFRSMRLAPPAPPAFTPEDRERADLAPGGVEGDDRRTLVGIFLRKTSLDELPQFLNVLRGDMSFVGPRPERPEFVERFGISVPGYGDRHRVKSGITGWAQVCNLRGQTSLSDRVEWDNYYIENWSLLLDLKILLLTVPALLRSVE